jgi:acyl-CoA synthetase (AMP-forming)/AMP-acid ligase II
MTTGDAPTATPSTGEVVRRLRAGLTVPGALFEVVEEDVRGTTMAVFRNRARSLRELLVGTERFGDRTYVVQDDLRLDFGGHLRRVDALATALQQDHGVAPGDRVGILAANRWEWIVGFWAAVSAGGVPVAFNSYWTPDEVAHGLQLTEPTVLLGDDARLARIDDVGRTPVPLSLDTDLPGLLDRHDGSRPEPVEVHEDDPAALIFTSGTTGRPKAVTLSHRGIIGFTQVNAVNDALAAVAMGGAVPQAGEQLPLNDQVWLVTSPLFHTSMLFGAVVTAVVRGMSIVLVPGRFDPERVLQVIERERVNMWMALGSAAPRVCASPALDRYDTSSVAHVGIGGAPVSPAVQQRVREAFPSTSGKIGMGYTSTEGCAVVANIGGPELQAHPTSTGRATLTTSIELRDELGQRVAEGELGEVHVRSPYVMLGYWRDPEASAAVLKDGGWLAMGDMARMVDGLLHIDSRARDMILVSAENVSPTEVEYRLDEHPDVVEAAVLAVDDPLSGDAVAAVVAVEPGSSVTVEELEAWCRQALARYKVPTRWDLTVEPLPRTPTGKLVKHRMRDRFPSEAGSEHR